MQTLFRFHKVFFYVVAALFAVAAIKAHMEGRYVEALICGAACLSAVVCANCTKDNVRPTFRKLIDRYSR